MINRTQRKAKQIAKKVLRIHRARKTLFIFFVPLSFIFLRFSRLFDTEWYQAQQTNPQQFQTKTKAVVHYLLVGRHRGFSPHPLFIPEYFDSGNWHGSLIDPLIRYRFDPTNRHAATSLFFDGKNEPLHVFLRTLNEKTALHYENKTITWKDLNQKLYKNIEIFQQQEQLRDMSRPVDHFDYEIEKQTLQKYDTFFEENNAPKVSIVTPAWNREDLIVEAIKSVKSQTYKNWEMLIVDDGSTDNTIKNIVKLQKNDPRIKLIKQNHGGVCRARNSALEVAVGEYVAFLDSDNQWTPRFLATTVASLEDQTFEAGYSAIQMENNGQVRYRTTQPNPKLLSVGNYIDLNALVVKRSLLKKTGFFDESLRRMVDYDLVCRINAVAKFLYVPIIGVLYTDHDDAARITTTELSSWDGVIKSKNFIDWDVPKSNKDKKATAIILPIRNDIRTAKRAFNAVVKNTNLQDDVTLQLIDSSSSASMNITFSLLASLHPHVKYTRMPASHDAVLGMNYGYAHTKNSDTLIFLDQRSVVEPGWLVPLQGAVHRSPDSIVAPLQLKHTRLIHSAGVVFSESNPAPINILENHPLIDIQPYAQTYEVPALAGGCFALKRETFRKLHGVNPLLDKGFEVQDLSLRAAKIGIKSHIAKNSTILNFDEKKGWGSSSQKTFEDEWSDKISPSNGNLWKKAGFDLVSYRQPNKNTQPIPNLKRRKQKQEKLRIAIKIAAPPDERRFSWGDLYFGQALADAFNNLGQQAFIDFLGAHERPTAYLDDVILDIRGLADPKPQPGKINIMWVISHPDDVAPETVKAFDIVYAAGQKWAEYMSKESGKKIEFLPQCTDTSRFKPPMKVNGEFANKILFVGNSRNVLRPIVKDATEANIDLVVYGGDWSGVIDSHYVKGTFIPNEKLAGVYGSSKFVLNDHWDDMRKWGFISNRIFDVVASGGEVVTDNILGVGDIFTTETVRTYRGVEDLEALNDAQGISKKKQKENYEYIRKHHSFDARAKKMIDDVKNITNNAI